MDLLEIKSRLRDYLNICNFQINKNNVLTCPNPSHPGNPENDAIYYEHGKNCNYPVIHCFVCAESWNIFDIAGFVHSTKDFKEQLNHVKNSLNISEIPNSSEKKTEPKKPEKINPVSIPHDKRKDIYKREFILKKSQEKNWGEVSNVWEYTDIDNNIIAIDVRFDLPDGKNIITWWYDGRHIKWYNSPALIYNLYEAVNSDKPLLINEGCKCAELARELNYFTPVSWNRGVNNADKIDWTIFKNKEGYILRDNDEPGITAAKNIQKQLPHFKIIKPVTNNTGDDIEQFLQKLNPEDLTAYILNPINIETFEEAPVTPVISPPLPTVNNQTHTPGASSDSSIKLPFKVMGIGDNGKAFFITEAGRLVEYALESLGPEKCRTLCNIFFWRNHYTFEGKLSYASAIEDLTRLSEQKDFNRNLIRGRGAWRDDNKISYHDGLITSGEYDNKYQYIRLPQKDIGINDIPINIDLITQIKDVILSLSFETVTDAVRCMSWTVLAPFCGALPFRPAILLTGPSSSGKTTVATHVINPISATDNLWLNGAETTPAYLRSQVKDDTYPSVFDETEADTEKKRLNKAELLTVMRASTSDEAPNTGKGKQDGSGVTYKMRCMFCFLGIDPTVEKIADANRIFQINMVKSINQSNWKKKDKQIRDLITDQNCRGLRAYTWNHLHDILKLSERLVEFVREKSGRDYRSSLADSLLLSAFFAVWCGLENPTDEQIIQTLDKYYHYQPPEEQRDEASELLTRLMDERIEIIYSDGDGREKLSIMECANRIYYGEYEGGENAITVSANKKQKLRQTLGTYGIKVTSDGYMAFRSNHHEIKKIINYGDGYLKLFSRHPGWIKGGRNESFPDKKTYHCGIIKGIIKKKEIDKTDEEKLEDVL